MPRKDIHEMMKAIDAQHGKALRNMAEGNGALLAEFRDCVVEIALRTHEGRPIPEKYAESVDELANEIVRRMNRT